MGDGYGELFNTDIYSLPLDYIETSLTAGEYYSIKVIFFGDTTATSKISLWWESPSIPIQVIPTEYFRASNESLVLDI